MILFEPLHIEIKIFPSVFLFHIEASLKIKNSASVTLSDRILKIENEIFFELSNI